MSLTALGASSPATSLVADDDRRVLTCRAILAEHGKSFALASRLLPQPARDDAAVVYALCRRLDDAIDEAPASEATARLAWVNATVDAVYSDRPPGDPVLAAFRSVASERNIFADYPRELARGMEMDATGARYETSADLLLYCYRVAGVVGLMMCHVLGVRHERALLHATHLGMAMQLTNICRDVVEDWQRGRLYLPTEWLLEAGAPDLTALRGGPFPAEHRDAIGQVVRRALDLADVYYRSGDRGLFDLSFRAATAIRSASRVYAAIGGQLRARGCDVLRGRAFVPTGTKLGWVAKSVLSEARSLPRRWAAPFRPIPIHSTVRFSDVVLCQ
ncbi:MAG: phytoene/squalene synthase family protein [Polyangiaceae bacterium]|nr:phytoene/squalene synthase family protein [Polyangiaceae bacterium]